MADKRLAHECDNEECVPVKPCRRCNPFPVRVVEDCDPIPVKLEEKNCEELPVKIKNRPHVRQADGDCWHVQGCKDGVPFNVVLPAGECFQVEGCKDGVPVVVHVDNPTTTENDNQFVFNGASWEPLLTPSRFFALDNVQITGSVPVWTPPIGNKFRLMGFLLTSSLAGQINFRDGVSGNILISTVVVAGVPFAPPPLGNGIVSAAENNPLAMEFVGGPGPTFLSGLITGQEAP